MDECKINSQIKFDENLFQPFYGCFMFTNRRKKEMSAPNSRSIGILA